jgi:uncharacterized protein YgiM (DUF1202 family)
LSGDRGDQFVKWICAALFFVSATAFAANGDPACARDVVTLHKGPGKQFAVAMKVAKYTPFLKVENKSGWVKVQDLDGEMFWTLPRGLTSNMRCVVVKTTVAALRSEPSTSSPSAELKTVDRYTPLKRLEAKGEWIHVEDETGHQAWIHETNVWKPAKIANVTF